MSSIIQPAQERSDEMTLQHSFQAQGVRRDEKRESKANMGSESEPEQQQNIQAQGPEEEKGDAPAESGQLQQAPAEQQIHELPFSVFGAREKSFIIMMASLAALFSPLSTNVYYPALNTLAADLHVSLSKINLTITTYLIFQGLAPAFIGSLSDEAGRRSSYIVCFVVYIGANIGLARLTNYPSLLILRMIQSSGSSGTVALANAVISDIVTAANRGTAVGYAQMGALVGPAFGPIIGGVLNQFLGWRSIFWFLAIFSGIVFLVILISLPETCRKIVGNGSIPTRTWKMSLLSYLHLRRQRKSGIEAQQASKAGFKARPNPLKSIHVIAEKECGLILVYGGTLFGGLSMVFSSMPSQFAEKYGFNTLQIGLCYIPTGLGSISASLVVGRFLNWNFRRHARMLGMEIVDRKQQDLTNFPIEAARLQVILPLVYVAAATVISYGWVMMNHTSLAGPVVLLYLSTFCTTGSFTGLSALVVDLNLTRPGTATAAMNLVRCWMGAGAVAFVNPLINAIGLGWTAVMVAAVWVGISPLIFVIMRCGPRWRQEKRTENERKEQEKEITKQVAAGNEAATSEQV